VIGFIAALAVLNDIITPIPTQSLPMAAGETYGAIRFDLERGGMLIGTTTCGSRPMPEALGLRW
jgi:hypothetical protein